MKLSANTKSPSNLPPGGSFDRHATFIGATVFHWFTPTEGNLRGPWQPLGGRASWTGLPEFWEGQIKQIMAANIDVIYLHCINEYEEQRINLFKAHVALRLAGYEVPKIAPFLDPFYLWREAPIDVGTPDGQDEFARHYIRFFEQYFAENTDESALSGLLHVDGIPVLTTWWVYSLCANLDKFSREDLRARIARACGNQLTTIARGIYCITSALIDPDLSFSDERMVMFSGYCYGIQTVFGGIHSWHVQAGYWDENIRSPGYFLPRDGGNRYSAAWDIVVANKTFVRRVYVESWNEYDEGSGIYASELTDPFRDAAMHDNHDTFSHRSDPYEYVRTTARGAIGLETRPDWDARVLSCEVQDPRAFSHHPAS